MKLLGFQIPNYTFPGVTDGKLFDHVGILASTAERAGFDSVFVMDHFYQLPSIGPRTDPMLEGYTVLAGIAARTNKIRLGTLVTGVTYRNPAFLAKVVTTLDIVSSGRAILGLGAAWNEDEHRGYGYEFPPVGERISRLEEALQICRAMFREEAPTFDGRYYRIEGALNFPRPIQPNGPPIMIGGGGEKVTLDELLRRSDYVSISCPLTRESRGMIGAREFAAMQKHAYFITTARGFIHDEAALLEALRNKQIAGAGLDVWAKEPPPPEHPLLQFDNVLASPHTAGVTREARENMGRIAAEQMLDALDGKRPPRVINPEVWPIYVKRFERTFGFAPG